MKFDPACDELFTNFWKHAMHNYLKSSTKAVRDRVIGYIENPVAQQMARINTAISLELVKKEFKHMKYFIGIFLLFLSLFSFLKLFGVVDWHWLQVIIGAVWALMFCIFGLIIFGPMLFLLVTIFSLILFIIFLPFFIIGNIFQVIDEQQ